MDFQRKKQIKKYIAWVCAVLLVFLLAVMPLLASPETKSDGPQASILSTRVEQREILEELLGGGLLAGDRMEELTVPAQVKLTEYLVGNGDVVAEGDPIAAVDRVSVMTAIAQVQETVEKLSADIESERTKTADTLVTAQAGGTELDKTRSVLIDQFFNANYFLPAGEEKLASTLGVSRRQLDRILKKLYGKGFQEKVLEIRLEVACDLLLNSEKTVQEISEAVGYSTPSNFTAFFKNATGSTPTQYRRSEK